MSKSEDIAKTMQNQKKQSYIYFNRNPNKTLQIKWAMFSSIDGFKLFGKESIVLLDQF